MKHCPMCGILCDERVKTCDTCGYDWGEEPPADALVTRTIRTMRRTRSYWLPAGIVGVVLLGCFGFMMCDGYACLFATAALVLLSAAPGRNA